MGFYNDISYVYDLIFPEDSETLEFLKEGLSIPSKILDLACGTGNYSIALSKLGHEVTGIDMDKQMINIANEKKGSLPVGFISEDMTLFHEDSLNLIFCIGNSLVHLSDKEKVKSFIQKIYDSLLPSSHMVIQIINFDRILDKNISSLPTIERTNDGIRFVRKYRHEKSLIYFDTELNVYDSVYKNSVPLLPLRSEELISMAEEAGFKEINVYGDFNYEEYTKDSYALVLKGRKL